MADRLDRPQDATGDGTVAAAHRDADRHLQESTLPDSDLAVDAAEARELVTSFRRIRDTQRGRFVADVRDLPAEPVRVATAIASLGETATSDERRHLLEDLVDLQSFVVDAPASLNPPPGPSAPTAPAAAANPLLEQIRWKQAALMAYAMGHVSVLGDHNAIRGRWTPIGDARAAINLVNDYRESQAAGFGALSAWPIGALIGFGLAIVSGNARPAVVALVVLGVGWFAAAYLGAAVGLIEARIERSSLRRTHPRLAGGLELVIGLGVIGIVPLVAGVAVTILATRLGLP
ncbi:MAG TPA: hypothetical protein VNM34_05340 [Verrucomicrobiae bacterium]|nr:hypothetical protein [Verrucomicrobiae bacterium]